MADSLPAGRIPCRCLLSDFWPDMHQSVTEYIAALGDDVRADDQLYQSRLQTCRACPNLMDGTCQLCGCYVEARAAKRLQRCPDVPPRWQRAEQTDL